MIPEQQHLDMDQDPDLVRPYHSKRPHKKSRNGCRNCKQRKVKCDEARPECRVCVQRKVTCVYQDPPRPRAAAGQGSPSSTSVATSVVSSPPSSVFEIASPRGRFFGSAGDGSGDTGAELDSNDSFIIVSEPPILFPGRDTTELQLLWFYTNKTFTSFVALERMEVLGDILKIRVVQHAFETPFLMDCLLGLTAMQMKTLNYKVDPNRQLIYQSRAFAGYRKAIEEAKPETFPGLIACSIMFTALSSTMFREGVPGVGRLKIISWIVIWRGIGLLVDIITPEELLKSGMSPLFYRPTLNLDTTLPHVPDYLHAMVDSISPDDPEAKDVPVYRNALRYLGALYSELATGITPILFLQTISWFTYLPTGFVSLVRQERPRALVIISHVCVFTKFIPLWWMENIGQYGIQEIVAHVCPEWSEYMSTPLNAINMPEAPSDTMRLIMIARILMRDPNWMPALTPVGGKPVSDPRVKALAWVDDEGREIRWDDGFKPTSPSEEFEPQWNIDSAQVPHPEQQAVQEALESQSSRPLI